MSKHFFDFEDGDFCFSLSDNMAMDMDSGDLHIISSWGRDDDDNDFSSNNRSLWDNEEDG